MTLTANREVDRFVDQQLRSYQVGGGETIYKGVHSLEKIAPLSVRRTFILRRVGKQVLDRAVVVLRGRLVRVGVHDYRRR